MALKNHCTAECLSVFSVSAFYSALGQNNATLYDIQTGTWQSDGQTHGAQPVSLTL